VALLVTGLWELNVDVDVAWHFYVCQNFVFAHFFDMHMQNEIYGQTDRETDGP